MFDEFNNNINLLKSGYDEIKNMANMAKQNNSEQGDGKSFKDKLKEGAKFLDDKFAKEMENKQKAQNELIRENMKIQEDRNKLYNEIDAGAGANTNILKMRNAFNVINEYSDIFPFPIILHKKINFNFLIWEKIPFDEVSKSEEFTNKYMFLSKFIDSNDYNKINKIFKEEANEKPVSSYDDASNKIDMTNNEEFFNIMHGTKGEDPSLENTLSDKLQKIQEKTSKLFYISVVNSNNLGVYYKSIDPASIFEYESIIFDKKQHLKDKIDEDYNTIKKHRDNTNKNLDKIRELAIYDIKTNKKNSDLQEERSYDRDLKNMGFITHTLSIFITHLAKYFSDTAMGAVSASWTTSFNNVFTGFLILLLLILIIFFAVSPESPFNSKKPSMNNKSSSNNKEKNIFSTISNFPTDIGNTMSSIGDFTTNFINIVKFGTNKVNNLASELTNDAKSNDRESLNKGRNGDNILHFNGSYLNKVIGSSAKFDNKKVYSIYKPIDVIIEDDLKINSKTDPKNGLYVLNCNRRDLKPYLKVQDGECKIKKYLYNTPEIVSDYDKINMGYLN